MATYGRYVSERKGARWVIRARSALILFLHILEAHYVHSCEASLR